MTLTTMVKVGALSGVLALAACASTPKTVTTGKAVGAKIAAAVPMAFDAAPAAGTKAICPVSKKLFTVKADSERSTHEGKHYVFCCPGCKGKFDAAPATFLSAPAKVGGAIKAVKETAPMAFDSPPAVGSKARCPVSGDVFTVSDKSERAELNGKHYAFCCTGCKGKFTADPAKFLTKK